MLDRWTKGRQTRILVVRVRSKPKVKENGRILEIRNRRDVVVKS